MMRQSSIYQTTRVQTVPERWAETRLRNVSASNIVAQTRATIAVSERVRAHPPHASTDRI